MPREAGWLPLSAQVAPGHRSSERAMRGSKLICVCECGAMRDATVSLSFPSRFSVLSCSPSLEACHAFLYPQESRGLRCVVPAVGGGLYCSRADVGYLS